MTKIELATALVNIWHSDWYDYVREDEIKRMVRDVKKSTLQIWYDNEQNKEEK